MLAQRSALLASARDILAQHQVAPADLRGARLPVRKAQVRQAAVQARAFRDHPGAQLGRDDQAGVRHKHLKPKLAQYAR